jgi:hypothetical protein
MISIYNYYIAKKRLAMTEDTIKMMGGENECQPMLLGQRDMIELEIGYYKEEMVKLSLYILLIVFGGVIMLVLHMKGMLHGF